VPNRRQIEFSDQCSVGAAELAPAVARALWQRMPPAFRSTPDFEMMSAHPVF
jgi:hypothetical protein